MAYQIAELQQPSTIRHGNSDAFGGHATRANYGEVQKQYASDLFFQLLCPCTKTRFAPLINHAIQLNIDLSADLDWIGLRETGGEERKNRIIGFLFRIHV